MAPFEIAMKPKANLQDCHELTDPSNSNGEYWRLPRLQDFKFYLNLFFDLIHNCAFGLKSNVEEKERKREEG